MALVGTISGSNGTSNTAVTGTLVIANVTAGFPSIPGDAVVYAQGRIVSTSDLVTSGVVKSLNSTGDEGGEIFLSKAVTNTTLVDGVTLDIYQNRLRIFEVGGTNRGGYFDISALGTGVGTNLGSGGAIAAGSDTYVQFNDGGSSFGGDAGLTYNKTTDSLTIAGNLTGTNAALSGDLAVNGGDITTTANVLNLSAGNLGITILTGSSPVFLISSGAYTVPGATPSANAAKILGANNKDVLIGAQTSNSVFISGSIVVHNAGVNGIQFQDDGIEMMRITSGTGVSVVSLTAGTNMINADVFRSSVSQIRIGSTVSTGAFGGDLSIGARTTLGGVIERMANFSSTNTVTCDMVFQSIFYVNNPTGNVTANFTKVPTTDLRIHTPTVILSQSATGRIVDAVQVDGVSVTPINWANGVTPTGNANKQDVFGFSLIRSGSAWKVLGQMSTFG